jgi:hypothetical protein
MRFPRFFGGSAALALGSRRLCPKSALKESNPVQLLAGVQDIIYRFGPFSANSGALGMFVHNHNGITARAAALGLGLCLCLAAPGRAAMSDVRPEELPGKRGTIIRIIRWKAGALACRARETRFG